MWNEAEATIDYLLRRANLDKPKYLLDLLEGSQGGFYDIKTQTLGLPKWIFLTDFYGVPDLTFRFYYVAHELSHALVGTREIYDHGELFYHYFNKVCPQDLKRWELDYLPDNERFLVGIST